MLLGNANKFHLHLERVGFCAVNLSAKLLARKSSQSGKLSLMFGNFPEKPGKWREIVRNSPSDATSIAPWPLFHCGDDNGRRLG